METVVEEEGLGMGEEMDIYLVMNGGLETSDFLQVNLHEPKKKKEKEGGRVEVEEEEEMEGDDEEEREEEEEEEEEEGEHRKDEGSSAVQGFLALLRQARQFVTSGKEVTKMTGRFVVVGGVGVGVFVLVVWL